MSKRYDPRKGYNWNKIAIGFIRIVAGWAICLFTGYKYKPYRPKSDTWLLLSNHTMDFDPLYDVITLKRFMRFVASANIMRGFPGCFVKWLANPIPREKGASADEVVEKVRESLNAGVPVAMYPEGNTSWDGETGFISRRTAELVKESKGSLITVRKVGGYIKMPRWSKVKRKGQSYGEVVAEYSRAQLSEMSVDEIYDIIKRDLYVNAYEEQEKRHWKYTCRALAEGLEAALYVCPVCGRVGRLSSKGDSFFCSCGAGWNYTDEGYLIPDGKKENDTPSDFDNPFGDKAKISVLEWSKWQKSFLHENAESLAASTEEPICVDDAIRVYGDRLEVFNGNVQKGRVSEDSAYTVFCWKDISKLSIFRATRLFFTYRGEQYEVFVDPEKGRVGQEYYALWRICTGKEYV